MRNFLRAVDGSNGSSIIPNRTAVFYSVANASIRSGSLRAVSTHPSTKTPIGRCAMKYTYKRLCAVPVLLALGLGIALSVLPVIGG